MNRPPATDFVLGHRAAVWVTTGTTALTALAALGHGCSWLVPVGAIVVRNACTSARRRVATWRNWTEAWNEMAASAQGRPVAPVSVPRAPAAVAPRTIEAGAPKGAPRTTRRSWLLLAWLLLLGWFTARRNESQTPFDGLLALCWLALTGWGALAAVASLLRRSVRSPAETSPRAAPDPEPVPDDVVTQCLPPAGNVVPQGHISDLLPSYCLALLARGRESVSSATAHSNNESEESS